MGENPKYYGMRFDRGSQNFGFHMIAQSQLIAGDRRRSQEIEHDSIFCDRLRSSTITIAGSQTIAEVCFHMIAALLRSAIRDHMETSLKLRNTCLKYNKIDYKSLRMQDRQKTSSYLFLLSCTLNRRFDSFTPSKNVSVYFENDGKTELQHDPIVTWISPL